jgi:hypothetical protein
MPKSPVPFHIQHIARPAHVERILSVASDNQPLDSESARLRLAQEGYHVTLDGARRSLDVGAKLGLFEKSNRSDYALTACGQAAFVDDDVDRVTMVWIKLRKSKLGGSEA